MRAIHKKIVILGDTGSGKTALVRRFTGGRFAEGYRPTTGAMPSKKTLVLEGHSIELIIWDIAGHLLRMHSAFTSDTDGAVLVCDRTKSVSMLVVKKWDEMLRKKAGEIPVVVAANKSDLPDAMGCGELEETDYKVIPTSAKTGDNVERLFMELVGMMMSRR